MSNQEECLICKAKLIYLENAEEMQCVICGETFSSNAKCENDHFVCDNCHVTDMDIIKETCLKSDERSPYKILNNLMNREFIHMHGPEHHVLVGASLLTAFKNSGGNIELNSSLDEMIRRGSQVPGGICGFWGTCGASVSLGIFLSIITESTPLSIESWGIVNRETGKTLQTIGEIGGPRCCKRNSYIAIEQGIKAVKKYFDIDMEIDRIICSFNSRNNQCIIKRCPFHKYNNLD